MRIVLMAAALIAAGADARAENYSSAGQSWATVYGFPTASDASVALSRAAQIRAAEQGTDQPTYNYNTYYDNRSNYIETNSGGGDVTGGSQIGDTIGEQTYSVGALNTGSTTVTVTGSGNTISSNNTATSTGCVNGSIVHSTMTNGNSNSGALVPDMSDEGTSVSSTVHNPGVNSTDCAP